MASKGTVALQLQIDTTFKNAKEAVASLNKTLEGIKVNSSITNASGEKIVTDAKAKAKEIQEILNQIQGSNYNGVNDKIFNNLFKQLESKASELKTLQDQLKNIDLDNRSSNPSLDLVNAKDELKNFEKELEVANQLVDEAKKKQDQLSYNKTSDSYREATEAVKSYTAEQNNLIAKVENQKTAIADLEEKQRQYNQSQNEATEVQNQINTALEQTDKVLEETNRIREQGLDSMSGQKGMLRELDKEQRENATSAENSADAQENLNNKQAEGTQSAENLASSTKEVGDAQGEAANNINKLSATLDTAIVKWVSFRAIVHTAKRAVEDIVQTYQELDDNLSAISAVSGIATDQLWGNMPQMIDNANSLALSIDDLTNGMLLFYQQGLSTEETEIRLNAAGKMAAISQQDLSTAVDQLTSTMNAFNMTGEDAQNVVDVFANMAGKTATDVEELATAMARTASIAKNAGMTFEQTTAFIATMEETTRLSAETIGNSMKSIIARFQKLKEDPESLLEDGVNANDVEKALKKADVALRDTEGNFRNIGDVIMELSAKWDTLDTNTQKYIATMAAGIQQSSNFIALVGNYQSNVDNLAYAMDSAGASEQQFEAISSNLSSAFTRLENEWTRLKTSFADGKNIISGAVDILSNLLHIISNIGPGATLAIGSIGLLTAKITALTVAQTTKNAVSKVSAVLDQTSIDNYDKAILKGTLLQASIYGLSDAEAEQLLVKKGIALEDAKVIIAEAKVTGANSVQTLSWEVLSGAISKAIAKIVEFQVVGGPVLWVIEGIAVALAAGAIAWNVYAASQKKAAEEAQENINTLKQSIEEHQNNVSAAQEEEKSLTGYSEKLKEAKENGEDLSEIKKEIADSFGEEVLGIDATKASYEELTQALEKATQAKKDFIGLETVNAQKDDAKQRDAEKNQLQDAWDNRNSFGTKSEKIVRGYHQNGEEVSKKEMSKLQSKFAEDIYYGSTQADTFEDYVKEQGFLVKVSWNINDAAGNSLLKDATEEDYNDKMKQLSENFMSQSEVLANMNQSGLNADSIGMTGATNETAAQAISLISKIEDPLDNEGNLSQNAKDAASKLHDYYTTLSQEIEVSEEDFLNFLQGNTEGLSREVQDALSKVLSQDWGNLSWSSDSANELMIEAANRIQDSFEGAIRQLTDQGVITEEEANKLGYSAVQTLADALEAGGADFASSLANAFQGILDESVSGLDSNSLQGIVDTLQDSLSNIDWSSGDGISDFINTIDDLESKFPELTSYLENVRTALGDNQIAVLALNEAYNQTANATEFLSQASGDGYDTFAAMAEAAKAAGVSLQNLNFYLDEASGKWMIAASEAQAYAQQMMEADSANANAILSTAALNNSLLEEVSGVNAATMAEEGLSATQIASAQAALYAKQQTAKAALESANAEVAAAQTSYNAALSHVQSMIAETNASGDQVKAISENENDIVEVTGEALDKIIKMYPEAAAAAGITGGAGASVSVRGGKKMLINALSELSNAQKALSNAQASQTNAQNDLSDINGAISVLDAYSKKVFGAAKAVNDLGKASNGGSGGGGSGGAAEASNELTDALEAQKKALQEQQKTLEKSKQALEDQKKALEDQKKALEETNKQLQENYKLYVELIKSRLNDEIDRQTTRVEAFYDAIKDTIQSEIDSFNDQLDALKKQADELKSKADELQDAADKQEDSLNKLYDAAQAYYDAAQDGLDNQIDSYNKVIDRNKEHINLLNEQKDAIQGQIDALDTAADSESKLLALEKARDALANARNQKTRIVLTNGGGWRLRTDKSEISNAQSNLASAQRDYQKEILERQQKKIEEQTDEIEKQNDNLKNIKSDLEDQKDALDDIKDQWDKAQDALGKTTSELEEQTNLIRQFQYGNDASRQDQLSNFSGQVSNNNQQQQAASDATNRANEASNKYDQQSNEDVQGSIAEAIKKLEEQQNQADEALKKYFENQLSNNAETAQIQQEMKDLINQMVDGQIGQLENFAQFYETINGALEQANTNASQTADYINNINAAIDRYDEWSNRLDMTTDEINQRQAIMNEINNATLGSLLEGGSTFGQLQEQYEQIVRNNDEAKRIQGQIDELDEQANVIQTQINALKEQENKISEQEKELSNANNNKTANAAKAAGNTAASGAKTAGSGIQTNADKNAGRIVNAINSKDISVTIQETSKGSGGGSGKYLMARYNTGGMLGFSHGGVDDVTTVAAVHGSKNRPELVLNNSQSAALFKYIDSMTRIPTLSSAGSARNALVGFSTTNNTNNNGTNFTNCEFNVESNADNLDSLVQDLKQSASIRR